jgi:hypothetical protein
VTSIFRQWQQDMGARIAKGEPTLLQPHREDPRTIPDPFEAEARRLASEAMRDGFDSIPQAGGTLRVLKTPSAAELRAARAEEKRAAKQVADQAAKTQELEGSIAQLQKKIAAREQVVLKEAAAAKRAAVKQMMQDIAKDRATRGKRVLDENELTSRAVQRVAKQERGR